MKTQSKTREATCFLKLGGARKAKKCVAGAGLSSVGRAAFLHNVIIGH
jgi:hypothetical protein